MNVTTYGVKGYEYQYKVTVYVSLLHLDSAVSLYVEKKNGEDVSINIKGTGIDRTIEVQVKNSSDPVDLGKLVEWLYHFGERSSDNNLLDRVLNKMHIALFVTSGRCLDNTAMFTQKPPGIEEQKKLPIDATWIDGFIKSLRENEFKETTSLQKARNKFCIDQADTIKSLRGTNEKLGRVIIWDNLSEEDVESAVMIMLNKYFKIPQSMTEGCYLQLLEVVRKGRDEGIDIIPLLKQTVQQKAGEGPVVDPNYKPRVEETILADSHKKNNVLLLTGTSLCGKSEIAKKIAKSFYENGFSYRIVSEVTDAEHFFSLNSLEDKICILEDPWGHLRPADNSLDKWRKLENIIRNKPANHFLIVTTRTELLQEIHPANTALQRLSGHQWIDITINDSRQLVAFWKAFSSDSRLSTALSETITNYLKSASESSLLQVGQLQHLARFELKDIEGKTLDQLLHLARQNSVEIAADLVTKDDGVSELLSIISISADTLTGLELTDLGYILSDDSTKYSIMEEKGMWSSGGSHREDAFPVYRSQYIISDGQQKHLEYLEKRGFVVISKNKIFLSHPNYYEAGRYLFYSVSSLRQERFFQYFAKALSCLSQENVMMAVKQLTLLINKMNVDQKEQVYKLAFLGFNSIFPSVEDLAVVFLIAHIEELPPEQKDEVVRTLDGGDTPTSHIFWHAETAYISQESGSFLRDRFFELPEEKLSEVQNKFDTDQSVSSFEAWGFVRAMDNAGKKFTHKTTKYLLQYNEIFIRKRIAFSFMSANLLEEDLPIITLLFSDEHPSVVFNAIKAGLMRWKDQSIVIKTHLTKLIMDALTKQAIAIRCNQLFTTFSKEHGSESILWEDYDEDQKSELWNVWGELYPVFIKQLPPKVFLNTGRFGDTIDTAFQYLTKEKGIQVLEAWYQRIDYKISMGFVLDEFELAIGDTLMAFTKEDYSSRSVLFQKLIKYEDTSFILSTLKWVVNYWDTLHFDEKKLIIELVSSTRKDVRWIKAVLLNTHNSPPAPIQLAILGEADLFDKDFDYILKGIDPLLLEDCLRVYFGHPQPLWWLALQHKNPVFWQKLIDFILLNEIEPYFLICLRELVSWGLQGFPSDWRDGIDTWRQVCDRVVDKTVLAERLIYDISRINFVVTTTKEMCSILLAAYKKVGKEDDFVKIVADKIEILQQNSYNNQDIFEIFESPFLEKVVSKLIPDALLLLGLQHYKDNSDVETFKLVLEKVAAGKISVRFFATIPVIKKYIDKSGQADLFDEIISKIPNTIEATGKELAEEQYDGDNYKLPDWIGIN